MKNFTRPMLLAALFGCFLANAQPLDKKWDSILEAAGDEQIAQAILLPNGRIAAVGSTVNSEKNRDGLFLLIDPEKDGEIVQRRTFGKHRDDAFNGLARANDGTFYLVGQSDRGAELGNQAWIVQLDDEGNELPNGFFGQEGRDDFGDRHDDRFEKIVWLDNGSALIAGFLGAQPDGKGRAWISTLKNGRIEPCPSIGEGMIGDIIGMERTPSGLVWICGNTEASDISKKGDGWAALLNERGRPVRRETHFGDVPGERFYSANMAWDSTLLIIGEINGYPSLATEVRIAEAGPATEDGRPVCWPNIGGSPNLSFGKAALKTMGNEGIFVVQRRADMPKLLFLREDRFQEMRLEGTRKKPVKKEQFTSLGKKGDFDIIQLIETFDKTIIVAGHGHDGEGKRQAVRFMGFEKNTDLASKGGVPKLNYLGQKLIKKSAGESLQPNDAGSLQLTFQADPAGSLIPECYIDVTVEEPVTGFILKEKRFYLKALSPGTTQKIDIPIRGGADLETGIVRLRVSAKAGGIEQKTEFPTIKCNIQAEPVANNAPAGPEIQIVRTKPGMNQIGEIPLDANSYGAEYVVISKNKVDKANFVPIKNKDKQTDQKANNWEITGPHEEANGTFTYNVKIVFQDLREGANEVAIEYAGQVSAPLGLNFQPTRPNLHILAIGPEYPQTGPRDLQFPSKDATEVAEAFARMGDNQFYNKVFVEILNDADKTSGTKIKVAFNTLLKKANSPDDPQRIKANDYLVVFYSGHGIMRSTDGRFCLQPSDYSMQDQDETFVDLKEMLEKKLNPINCKKLFLIDACLSGGAKAPSNAELGRALNEANRAAAGTTILASCSETELSWELPDCKNGAFTEALLEALAGRPVTLQNGLPLSPDGAEKNDIVTVGELFDFLKTRVPDLVGKYKPSTQQTPTLPMSNNSESLPIFIIK